MKRYKILSIGLMYFWPQQFSTNYFDGNLRWNLPFKTSATTSATVVSMAAIWPWRKRLAVSGSTTLGAKTYVYVCVYIYIQTIFLTPNTNPEYLVTVALLLT